MRKYLAVIHAGVKRMFTKIDSGAFLIDSKRIPDLLFRLNKYMKKNIYSEEIKL